MGGEVGPVADQEQSTTMRGMGEALTRMTTALELLDDSGAPADIAAHLDLAVHRLQEALGTTEDVRGEDQRHLR